LEEEVKSYKINFLITALIALFSVTIIMAEGQKEGSDTPKSVEVWMINSPVESIIKAFDNVGMNFESETGISVNYVRIPTNDFHTKLVTSISAGVYPDMIIWNTSPGVEFYETGSVRPVDDIVNGIGRDQFGEGSLKMFTVDGNLLEIPLFVRPAGLHARRDWLEKAGYDMEIKTDSDGIYYYEGLQTWEDLLVAAKKINDPSNGKYGMGFAYSRKGFGDSAGFCLSILYSYGASLLDKSGNVAIGSQETVEGLNFIKKIWESGVVPSACTTWDGGSNNQFFISGDIGMVYNSNSIMGKLNDTTGTKPENLIMIPFPAGPAGSFMSANPESITIFNKKNTEAAESFAKYLLKEETQVSMFEIMGFGYYSPLKKDVIGNALFDNLDKNQKVMMQDSRKAINVSYPYDPDAKLNALYSSFLFDDALSRIAVDGWSAEKTAAEMAQKTEEVIND
jgi:multiple sugar transport system substrate-binding protein